jgi:hypothetical protein
MTRLANEGLMYWRRFAVDLLTAGATFAVVLVAIEGASDMLSLLLLPGALIGLSLMVEPEETVGDAHQTRWSALLRTTDRAPAL